MTIQNSCNLKAHMKNKTLKLEIVKFNNYCKRQAQKFTLKITQKHKFSWKKVPIYTAIKKNTLCVCILNSGA